MLTEDDVRRYTDVLHGADVVCLQLQQPSAALLVAACAATGMVACDGAVPTQDRDALLARTDVLRADHCEAELLTDLHIGSVDAGRRVADHLRQEGPAVVALALPNVGNLVTADTGERVYAHADVQVVDATGAGDAFFAGRVAGLAQGRSPEQAGELAANAAAGTVQRLGGRPDLTALA